MLRFHFLSVLMQATVEGHHCFAEAAQHTELYASPRSWFVEKQKGYPMINRMAQVYIENDSKELSKFRRFWVKPPRHSETVSAKTCYLYRDMRLQLTDSSIINRWERRNKWTANQVHTCPNKLGRRCPKRRGRGIDTYHVDDRGARSVDRHSKERRKYQSYTLIVRLACLYLPPLLRQTRSSCCFRSLRLVKLFRRSN